MISEEDLKRSAERILIAPGLMLGLTVGFMLKQGFNGVESLRDALPQVFRLYPALILLWYAVFQPIHWFRVRSKERAKRER